MACVESDFSMGGVESDYDDDDSFLGMDDENVAPPSKKKGSKPAPKASKKAAAAAPVLATSNSNSNGGKKKTVEEMYQKKTQLEHILIRPDTYIGSVQPLTTPMFVLDADTKKIVQREITYTPGLYKIFDESKSNFC